MTISSFLVTYVSHVSVFPPQSNAYIYFIIFSTRVHTVFHCTLSEMRDHPASEHFQVDSDVKLVDVKVFKSAGVFFRPLCSDRCLQMFCCNTRNFSFSYRRSFP